ncbi:MAG: carbonic anhydrase [Deltaproteobacteria bacterium]|nr:carbonic anhydrase [Deltaproteobacteria bacterium]
MKQAKFILLCGFFLIAAVYPLFAAAPGGPGISADEALKLLKDGNARYVEGKAQHPHQTRERRALTAGQGQKPFATVLSCSDSRAPVEILFDRGVGDILVIRVAGNVAAVDEIGTMEYGVEHLNTPLVVVLGHSQCGAVTAAVEGLKLPGHMAALVKPIQPAVSKAKADNPGVSGEALVNAAVKANVFQAMEDLLQKSSIVKGRVKATKIRVIGAFYEMDTGQVQWLGPHPNQNKLVGLAKPGKPAPAAKKKGKN